jgi:cohesin domain-containing protein
MHLSSRKVKTLVLLPLLLVSSLALLGAGVQRAYATAMISNSPGLINVDCTADPTGCGYNVGATFSYTITATGLSSTLFASQYDFLYDPSVIQAQSVDPGALYDSLISSGQGFCTINIDNSLGDVAVGCTSVGSPTVPLLSTVVLGIISFQVMKLGSTSQVLTNAILLHNSGGGVLTNIPVVIGSKAIFTNEGFFAVADFPVFDNFNTGTAHRQSWPEKVKYSFSADSVHTPGILDLFSNINSTGNIPARAHVVYTMSSSIWGTVTVIGPTQDVPAGISTVVALEAHFNPVNSNGILMVGGWHISSEVFFQGVLPDGSLTTPVQSGATIKDFHVNILP